VFLRDSSPAPPDRSLLIKVNKYPCIGFKVNIHMGVASDRHDDNRNTYYVIELEKRIGVALLREEHGVKLAGDAC
jgi:hypothetical protein